MDEKVQMKIVEMLRPKMKKRYEVEKKKMMEEEKKTAKRKLLKERNSKEKEEKKDSPFLLEHKEEGNENWNKGHNSAKLSNNESCVLTVTEKV